MPDILIYADSKRIGQDLNDLDRPLNIAVLKAVYRLLMYARNLRQSPLCQACSLPRPLHRRSTGLHIFLTSYFFFFLFAFLASFSASYSARAFSEQG
jgi:hypothetical protein